MDQRPLGQSGPLVSRIAFGAFKIGRNLGAKYPRPYELPDLNAVESLLHGLLDAGINYIDTAPAYGLSEERIGTALAQRRAEFVLSTKVGETFENERSTYDFSAPALRRSLELSLRKLRTDFVDMLFIHSDGRDLHIQQETDAVAALQQFKQQGLTRGIGLSGKTVEGARHALQWADAIMVEYHMQDVSHDPVMHQAAERGLAVVVKKGLGSGRLPPREAIPFVLQHPAVTTLVIGGLNLQHIRQNIACAG